MEWLKVVTRKNPVLNESIFRIGGSRNLLDVGFDYAIPNHKIVDSGIHAAKADLDRLTLRMEKKAKEDPAFLDNFAQGCYRNIEAFRRVWLRIGRLQVEKMDNGRLKRHFSGYVSTLHKLMAYMYTPFGIEKILTTEIEGIIAKRIDSKREFERFQSAFLTLTESEKRNFGKEEQLELLKIGKYIQKSKKLSLLFQKRHISLPKDVTQMIDRHLKKWAWLGDHLFIGKFWTTKDIVQRLRFLAKGNCGAKIQEMLGEEKKNKAKFNQLVAELRLQEKEVQTVRTAKEYAYLRTQRLDVVFQSEYLVQGMLYEIARRMGLQYADMVYLTSDEIVHFLETGSFRKADIGERKRRDSAFLSRTANSRLLPGGISHHYGKRAKTASAGISRSAAWLPEGRE